MRTLGEDTIRSLVAKAWGLSESKAAKLSVDDLRSAYWIHASLADLFVDPKDEKRWLYQPLPLLLGTRPIDLSIPKLKEVVANMVNP